MEANSIPRTLQRQASLEQPCEGAAAACRAQGGLHLALKTVMDTAVAAHQHIEGTQCSAQVCVSEENAVSVPVKVDKHLPLLLSPQPCSSRVKHLPDTFLTASARNCCQLPRQGPQLCQQVLQQHVESASAS